MQNRIKRRKKFFIEKNGCIIGIDEVGRGALAGPVVVATVMVKNDFVKKIKTENKKLKLADSKKLTVFQREKWVKIIKDKKIPHAIICASPKIIDKINISNAANLAADKALQKLLANNKQLTANNCKIFLDGGLYINSKPKNQNFAQFKTKTIIKGDEKIPAISLASIVAKVYRDKLMERLHKKYPQYDFINNVGYGTKKHILAIKKRGLSKIHRKSFNVK